MGVLALTLAAVAAPRAHAWAKFNFGVGLNLSYEAANNCWLWGALRNGPTGVEYPNWANGSIFDHNGNYGNGLYNSNVPPGYGYPAGPGDPSWTPPAPTPGKDGKGANPDNTKKTSYFQPVAYPYADYGQGGYSSGSPSYYAWPYNYGYYQAPSYWYGR
jgi:hypothetical protein